MEPANKLHQLKQVIPFKWRVQSAIPKDKPTHVQMIAYVDARDVAEHLDNIIGIGNWQDKYEDIKGRLFCSIGVRVNDEWVWKSDIGTESNTEKEKGESSDAFKRAAVKWGINRDAYRVGMIKLPCKMYGKNAYPINDNGYFLKGQELYDHCNKLAKIEDLENFYVNESTAEITLEELKALYSEKIMDLTKEQVARAERIISNEEKKSYNKLYSELSKI